MSTRRALRRAFAPLRRPAGTRGALAASGLAIAAIVLQNAPSGAIPPPPPTPDTPTFAEATATRAPFAAGPLRGHLALAEGAVLAHGERTLLTELQVAAEGEAPAGSAPAAIVLVLDTSGSMAGEKIAQARLAVQRVVDRMGDDDLFGLVTYASEARVVAPLGTVAGRRDALRAQILGLMPGGGTQIPSGLRAGHGLLSGLVGDGYTRRLVLVSDGIDGSGTGPAGAAALVRPWASAGVTVAALGIGVDYQEAYLTSVADAGRGAYAFLATGGELEGFLTAELEAASKTLAEAAVAEVRLPPGARLVRAFGAEAEAFAGGLRLPLGALASGDSRRVTLELALPVGAPAVLGPLAATVRFHDRVASAPRVASTELPLHARVVSTPDAVEASRDVEVWARAQAVLVDAAQAAALETWRSGQEEAAERQAAANVARLRDLARAAPTAAVEDQLREAEAEQNTYGTSSADSASGRAFGLRSNAQRRARVRR